jgi:hypothetical protein
MKGYDESRCPFLTDSDILALIACPKRIPRKPPKPDFINRNLSQRFEVVGTENGLSFDVFAKCSSRRPSDFSNGLMLGKYLLYRCNGFHGTTKSGFYLWEHHAYPHAHILTMEDIKNGRESAPRKMEDLSSEFSSFPEAQFYFMQHCGIINISDYFDNNIQLPIDW